MERPVYRVPRNTYLGTLDFAELIAYSAGIYGGTPPSPSVASLIYEKPHKGKLHMWALKTMREGNHLGIGQEHVFSMLGSLYTEDIIKICVETFPPTSLAKTGDIGIRGHVALSVFCDLAWNPYTVNYLKSIRSAHRLCKKFAHKLLDNVFTAHDYWVDMSKPGERVPPEFTIFVQDLRVSLKIITILLMFIGKKKPQGLLLLPHFQSELLLQADQWIKAYTGHADDEARYIRSILKDRAKSFGGLRGLERKLTGKDTCALEGCSRMTGLKLCGNCESVCYCSKEHQAQHWADSPTSHKLCCFPSVYEGLTHSPN